jgi:uncharacterized membrane protein YjgN (DUF898 family)
MELVICLIPAVIVVVIAAIVINAIRHKPTNTTETNLQPDFQTSNSTGDVSNVSTPTETAVNSQNGLATTSLVFGILAILVYILFGPTWSNCMGPLAMIMGALALLQIRKQGGKGKGIAIAGILIGTLPFIITLVSILLITAGAALSK